MVAGLLLLATCLAAGLRESTSMLSMSMGPKEALLRTLGSPRANDAGASPLLCPESLTPLLYGWRSLGLVNERYLWSPEYGSKYPKRGVYWDLTINSEQDSKPFWELNSRERVGSRLFQSPFMSAIYERGYRQNFENAGFPGIDAEFAEASSFFSSSSGPSGGTVLDLSCGSGFMTRRFIASGQFGAVVSADLSPSMLAETARRCDEEQLPRPSLLRVDAARLPFPSNSLDYVHAGAAMHCWPRLPQSLSEVFRVLRPGGKFYASTFFSSLPGTVMRRREPGGGGAGGFYLFEDEAEIDSFVRGAGFDEVVVRKEGRGCAIVKAIKRE